MRGIQEDRELTNLFTQEEVTTERDRVTLSLEGYGFRWLRLRPQGGLQLP